MRTGDWKSAELIHEQLFQKRDEIITGSSFFSKKKNGGLTVIRGIECMRLRMNQSGTAWK